jgi:uncharacterized protein with PQ loop repeat
MEYVIQEEMNMSETSRHQGAEIKNHKAEVIGVIMAIITLLAPAQLVLLQHPEGEFATFLMGMLWMIFIGSPIPTDGGGSSLPPTSNVYSLLGNIPGAILKFIFVFQMYRFYQGHSSKKFTLILGVVSELLPILLFLPTALASNQIFIPIPLLLLIGLILIFLSPPVVKIGAWESLDESKDWYSESTDD